MQPPVESQIVASHSPQPPTAPIMVAPSITVPGSTNNIGPSYQESAEMTIGTNIGIQSRSLIFGNDFSEPVITILTKQI